jgi:hypothetical protein
MFRGTTAAAASMVMACGQALGAGELPPNVRVVNPALSQAGNGTSWGQAYADLQTALDAAAASGGQITEVWLAAGEYVPTKLRVANVEGSRTFELVQGVSIYGGFAGWEENRSDRNISANLTVLTGEPLAVRPFHVVTAQGVGRDTVLDGVRITGGASGILGNDSRGGGITVVSGSPTIRDCEIVGNRALSGGGVAIQGGSPLFVRTRIESNVAVSAAAGGGGVLVLAGVPAFVRCTIEGNICQGPAPGGGIAVQGGTVSLRDCRLIDNCSETGGALYASGGSTMLSNCLVRGNGDGIVGQNLSLIHCTIVDNLPHQTLGWAGVNGTGLMVGCIVWGNADVEMHGILPQVWGGIEVRHSCIAPNTYGATVQGPGVIRRDPRLNQAGELSEYSPCIDAGDNAAVPSWVSMDLNGQERFLDDAGMPDSGSGTGPLIDLGAFEFQGTTCYANCDGSTTPPQLNVSDYVCFLNRFMQGDPLANCDGSSQEPRLTVADFSCFISRFTAGCP